jgi:hypothetical protein
MPQAQSRRWGRPGAGHIEAERRSACRPQAADRQAWRDRRLMALAAHKRRIAQESRNEHNVIITCAVTGAIHTPPCRRICR